jgi:hypothetical protein
MSTVHNVTPTLIGTNKRTSCKGCVYRRAFGSNSNYTVCHYLIDTGKPRGCSAENCDKKLTKRRGKNNGRHDDYTAGAADDGGWNSGY